MTIIVKPKVNGGSKFSCDTYLFCDIHLYTAYTNVKISMCKNKDISSGYIKGM